MITLKNLSFAYAANTIFNNFNLQIKNGERICLFGRSGIGKTTLLRIIMGLEKNYSGTVNTQNAKISAVFQEDRLLPFKTVLQNVALFSNNATATECLKALGIAATSQLYPGSLSGGMARRVAIARALAVNADVYILDEPFSGLDSENIVKTAEFINKKINGKILIVVSHSPNDAQLLNAHIVDIECC